jgi:DNA-binding transcriptional MerR regulator
VVDFIAAPQSESYRSSRRQLGTATQIAVNRSSAHLSFGFTLYSRSVYIDCMNETAHSPDASFSMADLCVLADVTIRTARYYVQIGLVDRPDGETRAAKYTARHLEQLLLIKKWTAAGLSLERIRELLHGQAPAIPPQAKRRGSVEVRTHLTVSDGIELVIEPGTAGLSPEQVRQLVSGVMNVFSQVTAAEDQKRPSE